MAYIKRQIELTLEDLTGMMTPLEFERFIDLVSIRACGNEMLLDVELNEIFPLQLEVYGDSSMAEQYDDFIPPYGEETIWDMRRDEPEAFR